MEKIVVFCPLCFYLYSCEKVILRAESPAHAGITYRRNVASGFILKGIHPEGLSPTNNVTHKVRRYIQVRTNETVKVSSRYLALRKAIYSIIFHLGDNYTRFSKSNFRTDKSGFEPE